MSVCITLGWSIMPFSATSPDLPLWKNARWVAYSLCFYGLSNPFRSSEVWKRPAVLTH